MMELNENIYASNWYCCDGDGCINTGPLRTKRHCEGHFTVTIDNTLINNDETDEEEVIYPVLFICDRDNCFMNGQFFDLCSCGGHYCIPLKNSQNIPAVSSDGVAVLGQVNSNTNESHVDETNTN